MHAIVGLGTNLGSRLFNIQAAIWLMADSASVVDCARLYDTEPLTVGQPRYLNTAVMLKSELAAHELLAMLRIIEDKLGRERTTKWASRSIDLDILWTSSGALQEERLTIPHPRLLERNFALAPLLDVATETVGEYETSRFERALRTLGGPPPLSYQLGDYVQVARDETSATVRANSEADLLAYVLNEMVPEGDRRPRPNTAVEWNAPAADLQSTFAFCQAHRPRGELTTLTYTHAGEHVFRTITKDLESTRATPRAGTVTFTEKGPTPEARIVYESL